MWKLPGGSNTQDSKQKGQRSACSRKEENENKMDQLPYLGCYDVEGAGTPTALSGHKQYETRLLAPSYSPTDGHSLTDQLLIGVDTVSTSGETRCSETEADFQPEEYRTEDIIFSDFTSARVSRPPIVYKKVLRLVERDYPRLTGLSFSLGGGTDMIYEGDSEGLWHLIEAGMRSTFLPSP
ncbi:hypothetical protein BDM02DRAFT_3263263 [Thelephora ganbajun]|uniref:Uncharacterized protein n=1 Tax=Thelephora ganbajun TaxID=370292 RepID=A0ACB6Z5F9_THEGA|nr:hypothetical protein BDM02DRAFT_3263263 [Thelephora ganbajun]